MLLLSISRNWFQTASLDDIFLVLLLSFTLSNSIIFVKDTIMWRRDFEMLLQIKTLLISIKKFLYQCNLHYTMCVSSHGLRYLESLGVCNMCIIYLHLIETCLKVIISTFYFCHLKNHSNIMKNIFDSISVYSWKKIYIYLYFLYVPLLQSIFTSLFHSYWFTKYT